MHGATVKKVYQGLTRDGWRYLMLMLGSREERWGIWGLCRAGVEAVTRHAPAGVPIVKWPLHKGFFFFNLICKLLHDLSAMSFQEYA